MVVNKERFAQNTAILIVGLLMVSDLFFVDKKCFGKDFVSRSQVEVPFQESPADAENTKRYFKLPCFLKLAISWERASYFHKSIGGYSAVRPRRVQQLIDYQISKTI
jgi:hypothetical protein